MLIFQASEPNKYYYMYQHLKKKDKKSQIFNSSKRKYLENCFILEILTKIFCENFKYPRLFILE